MKYQVALGRKPKKNPEFTAKPSTVCTDCFREIKYLHIEDNTIIKAIERPHWKGCKYE